MSKVTNLKAAKAALERKRYAEGVLDAWDRMFPEEAKKTALPGKSVTLDTGPRSAPQGEGGAMNPMKKWIDGDGASMRRIIRAERLCAELGYPGDTLAALEELKRLRATEPPQPVAWAPTDAVRKLSGANGLITIRWGKRVPADTVEHDYTTPLYAKS